MSRQRLDLAVAGFREGDRYERVRPGYGADAVDTLCARLGVRPGVAVLDLAAGTGKLTRELVARGADVVAVDPVPGMRAQLAAALPDVTALDGTAEGIPLPDGAVDAVTVAQAFHWFDGPRAIREIHRVLRPGGRLGLLWNVMDQSVAWVERLHRIIHRHRGDNPWYSGHHWRAAFARTDAFGDLAHEAFRNTQPMDVRRLIERVGSISFVSTLPSGARRTLMDDVVAAVRDEGLLAGDGRFDFPYVTDVFSCARSDRPPGGRRAG